MAVDLQRYLDAAARHSVCCKYLAFSFLFLLVGADSKMQVTTEQIYSELRQVKIIQNKSTIENCVLKLLIIFP